MTDRRKLASVVVTFNRRELVEKNIAATLSQTLRVDKVFVINNHSTDDTEAYITERFKDEPRVQVVTLDDNYGGSGGFYHGLKYAVDQGFDDVLLMDDDGRPYNDQCFEKLVGSLKETEIGQPVMINSLVINDADTLTFGLGQDFAYQSVAAKAKDGRIDRVINPFNGTLVSRELTEKIGYPNRDFFIKGDEVDYFARAKKAGAVVYTAVDSLYYHPSPANMLQKTVLGRKMYLYVEAPFKEYYNVRNHAYSLSRLSGKKAAFQFLAKNVTRILLVKCKKGAILKAMIRGYRDGIRGKLGKADF